MQTDILVVGNGIAGLALSFLLHQKQIPHLVLNRVGNDTALPLAETLPPSALPLLQQLGLLELFESTALRKTYGYHSSWGSPSINHHHFYGQLPFPYGLKINKQAILQQLRAQQEVYLVQHTQAPEIAAGPGGFSVKLSEKDGGGTIQSSLIVDATGKKRFLLKALGIAENSFDTLVSFSCHVPLVEHPELVHGVFVESFEQGWGIVSGLDERTNVITLFTHRDNPLRPLLKHYANWPAVLSGTRYLRTLLPPVDVPVTGGNASSARAAQIAGSNWLAVGDAALSFDPLSSHGITNALYTVQRAAQALEKRLLQQDQDALPQYADTLAAVFEQYMRSKNRLYQEEKRWLEAEFWRGV